MTSKQHITDGPEDIIEDVDPASEYENLNEEYEAVGGDDDE